jgi:hypothetical protein
VSLSDKKKKLTINQTVCLRRLKNLNNSKYVNRKMTKTIMIFTLDEVYYDGDGDDTDDNVKHHIIGTLNSRLLYCANLSHNLQSHFQLRPIH